MADVDLSGALDVIEQLLTRPTTWLAGFALLATAGLIAPLLVRRLRWSPLPTLLTLLAGVVAGAVTLAPRRRPSRTPSLTDCAHTIGADLVALVPPTWQVLLNLVLFTPMMFFATLASRRPRAIAVFAFLAPLATAIVQGYAAPHLLGGRLRRQHARRPPRGRAGNGVAALDESATGPALTLFAVPLRSRPCDALDRRVILRQDTPASIARDEVVTCQTTELAGQPKVGRAVSVLDGVARDYGAAAEDGHRRLAELHHVSPLLGPDGLLQHVAEVDRSGATDGRVVGPVRVHCRRILRVVVGVTVTRGKVTLQEIRTCEGVLHLGEHGDPVADAGHRPTALDERLEQGPVTRVFAVVIDRSTASDPGHAAESLERLQIGVESRREIIANVLALLRPRIAVAHQVPQAHRVL